MRQGGLRPHSHSSGTYWVRATGKTGGKKKNANTSTNENEIFHWLDKDENGRVDWYEIASFGGTWIGVMAAIGWIFWLEFF